MPEGRWIRFLIIAGEQAAVWSVLLSPTPSFLCLLKLSGVKLAARSVNVGDATDAKALYGRNEGYDCSEQEFRYVRMVP
jgi:hypothetical protein